MQVQKVISRIFKRIKEGNDPLFYTKPQTYEVRYEAAVKNTAGKTDSLYIVLPLPPETSYQQLVKKSQFFPKETVRLEQDPVFNNKYAYWKVELASGSTETVHEEFVIRVEPRTSGSKLSLPGKLSLLPNSFIIADDPRIRELAVRLKKGDETDTYKIVQKFNEYVISHLEYGNPIKGLYSSRDALERLKPCPVRSKTPQASAVPPAAERTSNGVDCGGFDTLLAALCLVSGIPARIVSGFWAGYKENAMHAWLEIMLPDGVWIPADPSVEHLRRRGRTQKSGELGFVGSDRIALSLGCEIPIIVGESSFCADILQNPLVITQRGQDSFEVSARFLTAQQMDSTVEPLDHL